MFAPFMVNTWWVATIVAVAAGVVGTFVVLRGEAFVAHAVPNGSFAGAALAALVGVSPLLGLGVFSLLSAGLIGWLSRRGRRDVATALTLTFMLGLGALFLIVDGAGAPQVYSLLFGEVLGISTQELVPTLCLALGCLAAIALIFRPLLLSSLLPDLAAARGIPGGAIEAVFLIVVALATTMTVPVVGTLLVFSLMVASPAAARSLVDRPLRTCGLAVAFALLTVWAAIALSYWTDYPIGFFVGVIGAALYAGARGLTALAPVRVGAALVD